MVDWLNSVSRSELALRGSKMGVEVIKLLIGKEVGTLKHVTLVEAL